MAQVREDIHRRWRIAEATLHADCIKACGRHAAARLVHASRPRTTLGDADIGYVTTLQAMGLLEEAYLGHLTEVKDLDDRRAVVDRALIKLRVGSAQHSTSEKDRLSHAKCQRDILDQGAQEVVRRWLRRETTLLKAWAVALYKYEVAFTLEQIRYCRDESSAIRKQLRKEAKKLAEQCRTAEDQQKMFATQMAVACVVAAARKAQQERIELWTASKCQRAWAAGRKRGGLRRGLVRVRHPFL